MIKPRRPSRPSHADPSGEGSAPLSQEAGTFGRGNTSPELSWRKARPWRMVYGASRARAVGPRCPEPHVARGAAGTPASRPPTREGAHLRDVPGRGTELNLPRVPHPGTPRGGGDSRRPPGLGQGPRGRAARWAHRSRGAGPRSRRGRRRERTHLGEEVVHCSRALPNSPEPRVRLAEVSPADGPGKPCVSRRDSQEAEPAGLPGCHRLTAFSSFAPFVRPNPSL